jgi:hypothetical protein
MLEGLFQPARRDFASLDEREILSLAIAAEEEDGAIYARIAERLAPTYPASARVFTGMAEEEDGHRRRLLDLYVERFGPRLVPIRRDDVRGFPARKPLWLMKTMATPRLCRCLINLNSRLDSGGLRALVGSSRISTRAPLLSPLAISTIWRITSG